MSLSSLVVPRSKGKRLVQTKCPKCTSSDAFTVWLKPDGVTKDAHCYSCGFHSDPYIEQPVQSVDSISDDLINTTASNTNSSTIPTNKPYVFKDGLKVGSIEECLSHPIRELTDRKLSQMTCEKYGVRVGVDTRDGVSPIYHLYPFYDDEGELTGFKQRIIATKEFFSVGHCKSNQLFGSDVIKPTGNKLFITEGELDCLSVYQSLKENSSFDWDPAVVSLPHGAPSAVTAISENLELINGYEQIILVFDNDLPGKQATKEVCKILAGKAYVVKLSEKDPNDMLKKNKATDLKWAVLTHAKKYEPDGIVNAKDCWERYKEVKNTPCFPYPPTMPLLNEKMYGARPGSIITITSGSGCGKTQFLRELKYHFWSTTNEKIADIALEEDVGDTIGGLLSLHVNKRITLPDVEISEDEERKAFDHIFSSGRFSLYDHFGGMDDDNLFSKLRYYTATGHKLIFLDHLSIIVSEYASNGGERERIDTIMTKLAKLVKETGATIFLVVHLKKTDSHSSTFEQGGVPSLDDLRGSGSIKQLSWDVIGLSRNQQHPDERCANTSELHVLKCRYTGRTGHGGFLYFDDKTGRMIQTEEPVGYRNVR